MKKEYVFLDLKNYKKAKYIERIKVDNECKISTLKYEYKKETINELISFIDRTTVIGYDLSSVLVELLTDMYELKNYDCVFHYYDMKYYNKNNTNYRVFRGLNYKLYLLDNGYYVYDKGDEKLASYYIHKKELEKNCNYTEDEYLYLKNNGGNFITNIFHISEDTIKFTNEYTIYSDNKLKDNKYMIDKMKKALDFIKEHSDINIKLVCIGNLEELKENYKVLGKDNLEIILKLIIKEKELWSNW